MGPLTGFLKGGAKAAVGGALGGAATTGLTQGLKAGVKESVSEAAEGAAKNIAKNSAEEANENLLKKTLQSATKEGGLAVADAGLAKGTQKGAGAVDDVAGKVAQKGAGSADDVAGKAVKDGAGSVADEGAGKVAKNGADDAVEKSLKDTTKTTTKEGAEKATQQAGKQSTAAVAQKVAIAGATLGVGAYVAYSALSDYLWKNGQRFQIVSIVDSTPFLGKEYRATITLDHGEKIATTDKVDITESDCQPQLIGEQTIVRIISDTEIEISCTSKITTPATMGSLTLLTTYESQLSQTISNGASSVGKAAGSLAGSVVGGVMDGAMGGIDNMITQALGPNGYTYIFIALFLAILFSCRKALLGMFRKKKPVTEQAGGGHRGFLQHLSRRGGRPLPLGRHLGVGHFS